MSSFILLSLAGGHEGFMGPTTLEGPLTTQTGQHLDLNLMEVLARTYY
jgi:hypothetical protein